MKKLQNKLRELRKKKRLRQQDIAEYMSVAKSTYHYWESGKIEISNDNLFRLADFFEVTIDYLLGKSDNPTPPPTETAEVKALKRQLAIAEAEKIAAQAENAALKAAILKDNQIDQFLQDISSGLSTLQPEFSQT